MKLHISAAALFCLYSGCTVMPFTALGAPILYGQPLHQSPVMAIPGQPLMLPGSGFSASDTVVYRSVEDTTKELTPPAVIPEESGPLSGVAKIISVENVPYSLTALWPEVAENDRSYVIWVRDSKGDWSNGIRVNDARPIWISPAFVYETATIADLPRYIKVVGRSLHPTPGKKTQVKFVNVARQSDEYVLAADDDGKIETMVEQYVARVMLPPSLNLGRYKVLLARDGRSWVPLKGQLLEVREDPAMRQEHDISSYGCFPGDGRDDSDCILKAVAEAARSAVSGADVVLGEGVWNLSRRDDKSIELPQGVGLKGIGADRTFLVKGAAQKRVGLPGSPWFILQGGNTVRGITFKDETDYRLVRTGAAVFRLGDNQQKGQDIAESRVADVVISNNVFDKPFRAIDDSGFPIEQLFVFRNEFGAYENAIFLDGLPADSRMPFQVDDSIIADNVFKSSSYMDVSTRRGVIATQIGASRRLDFSGNVADGQSTDYLYDPENDPKGWRAAFFWHMRNNQEMLLVSQNTASCTGDKIGDGEFLAFDNNHNSFAFANAQSVLSATKDSVTLAGRLQVRHEGRNLPPGFFKEHWVQIADGRGIGQVRRITAYEDQKSNVHLTVTPPWDVIPGEDSRATIGLEFWQIIVVDNEVDHRKPTCLKSNRRKADNAPYGAGSIALWAQAADSVIAGNRQMDTNGIRLHPFYSAAGEGCPECATETMLQYFVEVRGNRIEGEYNWDSDCSWSGITVSSGASPTESAPPPAIAYGLTVAGNTVVQADGLSGGAVSIVPTWWDGPKSFHAELIRNTLINNNVIRDMKGPIKDGKCARGLVSRDAIVIASPTTRDTLIASNLCINTGKRPIKDRGKNTRVIRNPNYPQSCENR